METISTLEIDKKRFKISDRYIQALKTFLASIHSNIHNIIKTKSLVVNPLKYNQYKPNEENLAYHYNPDTEIEILFKLKGYHREVFGSDKIRLALPGIKGGIKVRKDYINNMLLLPLTRGGFFDDEYLNFIKPFLFSVPLYYNEEKGIVGFEIEEFNKKLFKLNVNGIELSQLDIQEISNKELLKIEVEQGFTNKELGDPYNGYGYTHKIRELLGMKFFYWQKEVIKNWNKINVVFAVRNSGKTAFAAYIGLREIISEKTGFGIRKERKVFYFVPDKVDIGEQIMDYITGYINAIFDSAYKDLLKQDEYLNADDIGKENLRIKYLGELKKLKKEYFKVDYSKYKITCNLTGNSLKLVSLNELNSKKGKELGTSKGEGLACDVYIIDEAPRIPGSFWESFWERAETESEYGYITGTLNLETPKDHWTYKLLIQGELGDENISSHRIALWNNEALFMNLEPLDIKGREKIIERERQKLLNSSGGLKNLYCRGYGIILDEKKVLDLSGCISNELPKGDKDDYRIMVIDFGGDYDPYGWFIYNVNTMSVEEEYVSQGTIKEQLQDIENKKLKYKNMDVVGDGTGAKGYVVMGQDKKSLVDIWISFSSGPRWDLNKKGSYSVDKGYMVELAQQLLSTGKFKLKYTQENLIEHANSLVRLTDKNANVQKFDIKVSKGKSKHHGELAMCILMLAAYLSEGLGLTDKGEFEQFGELGKIDNEYYQSYNEYDNDIQYLNGLY